MTDDELKQLVASLAVAQQETESQLQKMAKENRIRFQEISELQKETDKQLKELGIRTDKQLKELGMQTDKQLKELGMQTDKQLKELGMQTQELGRQTQKLERQTQELGQQIGGLGKKFGSFTEGLALPSMSKILRQRFQMEVVSPSVRVRKGGEEVEIDVLAYANSHINEAYIVEVKSHLREEAITQLHNLLSKFKQLFPEHQDKKVYGIIAAVDMSDTLKQRVLNAGFYVARIHDDTFSLETPADFTATAF